MTTIILTFFAAYIGTWLSLRFAPFFGLIGNPNSRSSHASITPHGGGVGIVLAGTVAGLFVCGDDFQLLLLLALGFCLAVIGFLDDVKDIPARYRFLAQILLMIALVYFISEGAVPNIVVVGAIASVIFMGLWWVNLFNFMDGIDGIAAVQAISMLMIAAGLIVFFDTSVVESPVLMLMLIVVAATFGFLVFNWSPAKIFMGDVGSLWLAFVIYGLALLTIKDGWMSYESWLILAAVFITDATTTLCRRILKGEKWFEAHRSHLYQRLCVRLISDSESNSIPYEIARAGAHRKVTLGVLGINCCWLAPLAFAAIAFPVGAFYCLMIAYVPLVVAAYRLRNI